MLSLHDTFKTYYSSIFSSSGKRDGNCSKYITAKPSLQPTRRWAGIEGSGRWRGARGCPGSVKDILLLTAQQWGEPTAAPQHGVRTSTLLQTKPNGPQPPAFHCGLKPCSPHLELGTHQQNPGVPLQLHSAQQGSAGDCAAMLPEMWLSIFFEAVLCEDIELGSTTPVLPFQFCTAMVHLGCRITAQWNLDTAMSKAHCRVSTAGQPQSRLIDHQLQRASGMRATAQRFLCPLEAAPGRVKHLSKATTNCSSNP